MLARRLLAELATWDVDAPIVAEGLGLELVATFTSRGSDRSPPSWLERARDFLDASSAQVHLRDVAAAAGVHPVHLTRAFRKFFKSSPGYYLRARRLHRAASMLTSNHRSVVDVALATGFADQAQSST